MEVLDVDQTIEFVRNFDDELKTFNTMQVRASLACVRRGRRRIFRARADADGSARRSSLVASRSCADQRAPRAPPWS